MMPWSADRPDRWWIHVREVGLVSPPLDRIEKRDAQLLVADVWLADGRVVLFEADGTHVHSSVLRTLAPRLVGAVADNARATQEEVDRRGGRFGPKDRAAFLRALALDLRRLEPVLGNSELVEVSFPLETVGDGGRQPLWMVLFLASSQAWARTCYGAFYEPFDGRLVSLRSWRPGTRPNTVPGAC